MTKTLHLTLKKEPFDLIALGEKTSEYREYKPFWIKRLLNPDGTPKQFDNILFRNGYHKDAPTILIELKSIHIIKERTTLLHSTKLFEIKMGNVLAVSG